MCDVIVCLCTTWTVVTWWFYRFINERITYFQPSRTVITLWIAMWVRYDRHDIASYTALMKLFLRKDNQIKYQRSEVNDVGSFVQTNVIRPCLYSNLRLQEREELKNHVSCLLPTLSGYNYKFFWILYATSHLFRYTGIILTMLVNNSHLSVFLQI